MRALDITGNRYGMLSVIAFMGRVGASQALWKCKCDCGNEVIARLGNLRNGHTRSCGCQRSEVTAKLKTTHGMYGTPEHRSWTSMLTRCENTANHKYPSYGGRGITVCNRWRKFENFFADMGQRPKGTTLGRLNNNGDYEPNNCCWETTVKQGRNKRNTALYFYNGKSATIAEHCERLGLNSSTVRSRIYTYGWPIEKAFSNNF